MGVPSERPFFHCPPFFAAGVNMDTAPDFRPIELLEVHDGVSVTGEVPEYAIFSRSLLDAAGRLGGWLWCGWLQGVPVVTIVAVNGDLIYSFIGADERNVYGRLAVSSIDG